MEVSFLIRIFRRFEIWTILIPSPEKYIVSNAFVIDQIRIIYENSVLKKLYSSTDFLGSVEQLFCSLINIDKITMMGIHFILIIPESNCFCLKLQKIVNDHRSNYIS